MYAGVIRMDKKAIETLSVNAVRASIVQCRFLDQFIPDNDKEPSWDGNIYVYKDKRKGKSTLLGRMPVQVKGTKRRDFSKDEISFSVAISDLHNYLNDGGAMFFVVYVNAEAGNESSQIYYAALTPIKIRTILRKATSQKSIGIKLKRFPKDEDEKTSIVINCIEQCKKQMSYGAAILPTLDELCRNGAVERLEIPIATNGNVDPRQFLLSNDVYVYAKLKGSAVVQPIEMIPKGVVIAEVQPACVMAEGRVFYDKVRIRCGERTVITTFGQSVSLIADKNAKKLRIEYKSSDSLRNFALDLDFMLSYISAGEFFYDGVAVPFDQKEADLSRFKVEDEQKGLLYAKEFVALLDELGCKKDVCISAMSDADWNKVSMLIRALINKEPILEIPENLPAVFIVNIEKLRFMFYYKIITETPKTYALFDFFRNEVEMECLNQGGERVPISQYAALTADDFLHTENLRLDVILPSFQKTPRHNETIARANIVLLELLKAYDVCGNPDLLKTAEDFSTWIMAATDQELQYSIRLLNDLQIKRRKRSLTTEEEKELVHIAEDQGALEQIKVGAYLLLNQQTAARIHFERLRPEEQKEFRSFPIFKFCDGF